MSSSPVRFINYFAVTTLIMQDFYKPYFEAVKNIIDGNPVKELDDIRKQCNEAFLKAASLRIPKRARIHNYEAIVLSFVADAENNILMGIDPVEAYGGFRGLEPAEFRQRGRKILENAIQQYLR